MRPGGGIAKENGGRLANAFAVAAFACIIGFSPASTAAPGTFEVQLGEELVQRGADKKLYQDLFGRPMPAGTWLSGLKFLGTLKYLGQNDRTLSVNGVFDGIYTSNELSFRGGQCSAFRRYCAKVRADLEA